MFSVIHRKRLLRASLVCFAVAALACVVLIWGCAAKVPATGTTVAVTGTPIEQALAYNAALANANLAIANAVIGAQQANLLSVDTANRVTTAQSYIADGDRQLTMVLQTTALCLKTGTPATCKTPAGQVQTFLTEIQNAATGLVSGPDLGIKDAATKQKVLSGANTVLGVATSLTAALTAAGVI